MARYELIAGSSAKFWEVNVESSEVTVRYGRIGSQGQTRTKSHASPGAAIAAAETLTAQKLKKGYAKATTANASASKLGTNSAPPPKIKTASPPPKSESKSKIKTASPPPKIKLSSRKVSKGTETKTVGEVDDQSRFTQLCLGCEKSKEITFERQGRCRSFIILGVDREFAFWDRQSDQGGMHLRYSDPSLLDDNRYEPSTKRGKSNWMHVLPATHDWSEIEQLVRESHTAAQQRGGGHLAAKQLYIPLKKGYEAAAPSARPQSLHAQGPAAKILANEGPAAFRLGLWAAEQIEHLVPKNEKAALTAEMARLRAADKRYKAILRLSGPEQRMGSGYDVLKVISGELYQNMVEGSSLPVACARAVNETFRDIPGGYSQRALSDVSVAIERAVEALAESGGDKEVTDFLIALDERVMLEEFAAMCQAKKKTCSGAIEKVLWRGADAKGYPAFWISRIGKNLYAFLGKIGRRWALQEDVLEDILALIPDDLFAVAAMTVLERNQDAS